MLLAPNEVKSCSALCPLLRVGDAIICIPLEHFGEHSLNWIVIYIVVNNCLPLYFLITAIVWRWL